MPLPPKYISKKSTTSIEEIAFSFSKIFIIESLEENEVRTGNIIANYVRSLPEVGSLIIEIKKCESAKEFLELIEQLTEDSIINNNKPLLHVECHGDKIEGLEFSNGSTLSWPVLSTALTDLNRATGFNLLAIFSACYGAHFISQLSSVKPAPCYAMFAPTELIDPAEILSTFRVFYQVLFATADAGIAAKNAREHKSSSSNWLAQRADLWYEHVVIGYIENQCRKNQVKQRARKIYERLKSEGIPNDIGNIKRLFIQKNRNDFLEKFFKIYFLTNDIPNNELRFKETRLRMEARLKELQKTGRYGI